MNDNIADMLNRIYTASLAGNKTASFPATKMTESISKVLQSEGYINSFTKIGKDPKKDIEVEISYRSEDNTVAGIEGKSKAVIEGFSRVSKPSKRVYAKVANIRFDRPDRTMLVLSTPKGILTEKEAREAGVGGEVLFEIW